MKIVWLKVVENEQKVKQIVSNNRKRILENELKAWPVEIDIKQNLEVIKKNFSNTAVDT